MKQKFSKKTNLIIAALSATAILTACSSCTESKAQEQNAAQTEDSTSSRFISQDDFTRTAEQTVNGIVSVKSYATPSRQLGGSNYFEDPLFEFFFGSPRRTQPRQQEQPRQQQVGLGSGVIISADGYIVTNNHVIADAERLEVTLNDNQNFEATVVGTDPTTDLALIKIEPQSELHVIPMGDSEKLRLGEWVLAVGNPFGFTSTVTSGIVSAKARNISTTLGSTPQGGIESFIQTDAALNPGNSGGALVNLRGELVGINTAIYSQTGTYAGCSFAIPVSIVQKVIGDLKKYGTVQRAYLGIRFIELSPELINEKNIKGVTTGIYVADVEERSAAIEAGLAEGDVIVAINDKPIRSTAEMQEVITRFSPGDRIDIEFFRNGSREKRSVTLLNREGNLTLNRRNDISAIGATFSSLDSEECRRLKISSGVRVDSVDHSGRFYQAGIREGFIILAINNQRITDPKQITSIFESIHKNDERDKVMFISGLLPTGKSAYYAVPLAD